MTRAYSGYFHDPELEGTQFTLLQTLHRAGELTQRQLGGVLLLDSTTLSRTLRPLARRGWIAIRPGEDRREKRIAITASGTARMLSSAEGWDEAQARLKETLGDTGWREAMQAIGRITAAALMLEQGDGHSSGRGAEAMGARR